MNRRIAEVGLRARKFGSDSELSPSEMVGCFGLSPAVQKRRNLAIPRGKFGAIERIRKMDANRTNLFSINQGLGNLRGVSQTC